MCSAHCAVVDAIFAERRLAEIYDPLDTDRSDLQVYATLLDELGARSVLAASLERRGMEVIEVRDAPDRPGREWVYLAQRPL